MINSCILEGDFISYQVKDDVGFITIKNEENFLIAIRGKVKDFFETKKDNVSKVRIVGRLKPTCIVAEYIEVKEIN